MKVLWIVSFPIPEVSHLAGVEKSAFGGWVSSMLNQLSTVDSLDISVAMKSPVEKLIKKRIKGVNYYLVPQSKKDHFDVYQEDCDFVLKDAAPELLHAEGTECAHTLRFLRTWKGKNVVSMQGILNGYEPYEYGNLPVADMIATFKGQAAIMSLALISNKLLNFKKRVNNEMQTISLADNILGRTTWDRAHSYAINSKTKYYSCYRILREPFYAETWDVDKAEKYSIFIGNSSSPRKGVHFVFHAVAQLKKEFPDIKVYIAGERPYKSSWKDWKRVIGYPAYLQNLMKYLDIEENIEFIGVLPADEMAKQMCQVNVCVLSSIIENSPNTLGEAMIMGVPAITSYVGGAPDMAKDGEEAMFYRDNDPQLLAYAIKRVFNDEELALRLSKNGRKRALATHDPQENLDRMVSIYNAINVKIKK
jgi:L-malate glycosyltransferase